MAKPEVVKYGACADIPASKIELIISEYVHNARDRDILRRKWLDEATYETIAEEFSLSVRGTQYIVQRYRKKLLKYFS